MKKLLFNSGNKINVYYNGEVSEYSSDFFDKYIDNSIRQTQKDAWKHTGFGAEFRGDAVSNLKNNQSNENILSEITSLSFNDENTINYSIFINSISAVYSKNLTLKKDSESHIIHDNNRIFKGSEEKHNKILLTLSNDGITSHLAIFDKNNDDYTQITDGDSFDSTPTYSKFKENTILFSSKGVGRDGNGNFVEYSPSYITAINNNSGDVYEIFADENYSFIKPKDDKVGNVYAIRRPVKEKKKRNILLDILLIPYRFFYFLYMYFDTMSNAFTGKGLTGKSNSQTATKDKSKREVFIEGNLIYADKEYKNNLKHKDDFAGIIPRNYELVKINKDGNLEVIRKGVIAFDIDDNGDIYYSNGKYIIKLQNNKVEKICEANLATTISII